MSGGGGTGLCSHYRGVCTAGPGRPEDRGALFHAVELEISEHGDVSGRTIQAFDRAPPVRASGFPSLRSVYFERFESSLWQTSSLLLVADAEAVVIDPCISTDEVARIAGRAATLGARVTHVLATHADWDHVCGIAAFPDAVATMGSRTAEIVAGGGPGELIRKRAATYELAIEGNPRVDRALTVGVAHQIGPFTVETIALRGHTDDGTAYRIRELDLLAVGDHLSAVEFPFASTTSEYRTTLATLIDLLLNDPPAHVVPGHGPALTAAEALTIAEADLAYLRALRDAVVEARATATRRVPRRWQSHCRGPRRSISLRCTQATSKRRSRSSCLERREVAQSASAVAGAPISPPCACGASTLRSTVATTAEATRKAAPTRNAT